MAVVDAPAGPVKATVPDAKQPTQEPAPRQVEDPPQTASDALAPWAVGGFVDTQYIVNSNSPDNHIFRGTPVSARTGEFSPNLIVGYVRRDPIKSPWMFDLALQAGVAADALYYTEPVAGGTAGRFAGVETWKHIGRAWTGVKLRGGTEVFVGAVLLPVLMCSAGGLGDQAALERLIASGAEVDAADYDGRTALHLAAAEGQVAAAALLLAKGARVSAVRPSSTSTGLSSRLARISQGKIDCSEPGASNIMGMNSNTGSSTSVPRPKITLARINKVRAVPRVIGK